MLNELQKKITVRDSLTVNTLGKDVVARCSSRVLCLLYQSNALAGEAGEFANIIKKMVRDELSDDTTLANLNEKAIAEGYYDLTDKRTKQAAKELADVVQYAALAAQALGVRLSDEVVDKFNEVSNKLSEIADHIKLDYEEYQD